MLAGSKIRKRGGSLSSGGSSSFRRIRLKKRVPVGRRGGAATPAPAWKLSSRSLSSSYAADMSAELLPEGEDQEWRDVVAEKMSSSLSVRKLVSALWQLDQQPPSSRTFSRGGSDGSLMTQKCAGKDHLRSDSTKHNCKQLHHNSSDARRSSKNALEGLVARPEGHRSSSSSNHNNSNNNKGAMAWTTGAKKTAAVRLCDLQDSVLAAKELTKMLLNICSIRGVDPSMASLMSTLHSELSLAAAQLRQLAKDSKNEDAHVAVNELDGERKRRRRAEKMNRKLGAELAKREASLLQATEEAEREKRSRDRVERICNELVRGVGREKAELEELRAKAAKAQEEVEKEREMLQLADEWREERVQMKLLEARFQFEEKNAAIDQLRNELESFLSAKKPPRPLKAEAFSNRPHRMLRINGGCDAAADLGRELECYSEGSDDAACIELNVDGEVGNGGSWRCIDEGDKEHGEEDGPGMDEDAERYELVRLLREHLLAGRCIVAAAGEEEAQLHQQQQYK